MRNFQMLGGFAVDTYTRLVSSDTAISYGGLDA